MERISKNKIKFLRALRFKKNRESEGCFLIEGEKMVKEAVAEFPDLIKEIYLQKSSNLKFDFLYQFEMNDQESTQISELKAPNKCMALMNFPRFQPSNSNFVLALDTIQDPGNLGTIIRQADWFGISEIVCSKETVDCFNPKVVQASMGSIFRVEISYTDLVDYLSACEKPIYGALLSGENIYTTKLHNSAVLVLGNEGQGISEKVQRKITHSVTIPRFGKAESLNVASASSILLSEFFRG